LGRHAISLARQNRFRATHIRALMCFRLIEIGTRGIAEIDLSMLHLPENPPLLHLASSRTQLTSIFPPSDHQFPFFPSDNSANLRQKALVSYENIENIQQNTQHFLSFARLSVQIKTTRAPNILHSVLFEPPASSDRRTSKNLLPNQSKAKIQRIKRIEQIP
jgi:hypothetical protein